MTAERPYFSSSIEELENIFAGANGDAHLLKKLAAELKFRKRPRARKLQEQVMDALARACAKNPAVTANIPCSNHGIDLEKKMPLPDYKNIKTTCKTFDIEKKVASKGFFQRIFGA